LLTLLTLLKTLFYAMVRIAQYINRLNIGMLGIVIVISCFTSCKKEDALEVSARTTVAVVPHQDTLRGIIAENTLLINNRIWYIDGLVYVGNEATLTIEQGTTIKVLTDSSKGGKQPYPAGGLIITRGARILANGTSSNPINFTVSDSSDHTAGGWSGIILLGRAPVNKPFARQDNLLSPTGYGFDYGGELPDDSSGVLQHVRLSYLDTRPYTGKQWRSGLLLMGTGSHTIIKDVTARAIAPKHQLKKTKKLP
jgi:hypothetical protein